MWSKFAKILVRVAIWAVGNAELIGNVVEAVKSEKDKK